MRRGATKRFAVAGLVVLSAVLMAGNAQSSRQAEDQMILENLMEIAIMQERTGDLHEAIRLYRKLVSLPASDALLRIEAVVRMGRCEMHLMTDRFTRPFSDPWPPE